MRTRFAAVGGTAALAAAAVLVAAPAAEAKTASLKSSYSCQTDFGAQEVGVTTTMVLPAKVKKNKLVAAKPVKLLVVIPESLATLMRTVGITSLSGSASGVKASVGTTKVAVKGVKFPATNVPASGPMKIKAAGTASAFKIKKPGTYVVSIPKSFKFTAKDQNGNPLLNNAPCTVVKGAPTKLGKLKVVK
ncbi:DUF6801 domain-containing protein [Nocardioides conyzicola]|uniref:DUF6801 domain-containing protein n=1 Tax=Nocardioides conyzicola TaxID=1651781 RepID=A0ABP8WLA4_9ACTN